MLTRLFPRISLFLLVMLAVSAPGFAAENAKDTPAKTTSAAPAVPDYGILPGDILMISVWREEGLQGEVLVRPDGGISFPLVGDIQAAGKSVKQISALITEQLTKYIPDPVVNVAIKMLGGNKVYVIGKVNRPGEFPITSYVDVMQALSMAGGANAYASLNNIKILRRENGVQRAIAFRYADIESGKNLEQNVILRSGDVVVVP